MLTIESGTEKQIPFENFVKKSQHGIFRTEKNEKPIFGTKVKVLGFFRFEN